MPRHHYDDAAIAGLGAGGVLSIVLMDIALTVGLFGLFWASGLSLMGATFAAWAGGCLLTIAIILTSGFTRLRAEGTEQAVAVASAFDSTPGLRAEMCRHLAWQAEPVAKTEYIASDCVSRTMPHSSETSVAAMLQAWQMDAPMDQPCAISQPRNNPLNNWPKRAGPARSHVDSTTH
ncbi:MAG: hypothetical protein AB8B62_02615 [Roseobacter sp.]